MRRWLKQRGLKSAAIFSRGHGTIAGEAGAGGAVGWV